MRTNNVLEKRIPKGRLMTEEKKNEPNAPETQTDYDENTNDPQKDSDRGHGCLLTSLIALIILPVLYFLSIGPVIAVFAKLYDVLPGWAEKVLMGVYFPIIWLAENNDAFENFVKAYLEWWFALFGIHF